MTNERQIITFINNPHTALEQPSVRWKLSEDRPTTHNVKTGKFTDPGSSNNRLVSADKVVMIPLKVTRQPSVTVTDPRLFQSVDYSRLPSTHDQNNYHYR